MPVLVAAVLLAAGCVQQPGTAAVVDGQRITDGQLADLVTELTALSGVEQDPMIALNNMVVSPLVVDIASDLGVGASTQEAEALLADYAETADLGGMSFSNSTVLYAQASISQSNLQTDGAVYAEAAELLSAGIVELDVEVNPRFGTWDAGAITATTFPWLLTESAAGS